MQPDGEMTSGVMFVAEALGHHEAVQERALVGNSGFVMARALSRRKWGRDDFAYANVLWCQPHKNVIRSKGGYVYPWAQDAIDHCAPYLDAFIDERKPKCIVALGETAFERLTGYTVPLIQARGYAFREQKDRCWVVPTWHPAFMLREKLNLLLAFNQDVAKARRIAVEGYHYEDIEQLASPGVAAWERYIEDYEQALDLDPTVPLGIDTETPDIGTEEDEADITGQSPVDSFSFAYQGNRGVTVPNRMPYTPGIQRLLAAHGIKIGWNAPFDTRKITQAKYRIEGRILDVMDMFHVCYNNQPKKLGYATSLLQHRARMWKHLGTLDETYQVCDAVWLVRNYWVLKKTLRESGMEEVYDLICTNLDPVLGGMTRAGMPVDPLVRANLSSDLAGMLAELEQRVDRVVPLEVRAMEIKKTERGIEGVDPALLVEVPGTKQETTCGTCGVHPVTKMHVTRKTVVGGVHE